MSLPAFFDLYIDEEVRARYREEGKAEGKAEGRLEGERLQAFATTRKLLRMGLEVRNIAIVTGLSISEIESTKRRNDAHPHWDERRSRRAVRDDPVPLYFEGNQAFSSSSFPSAGSGSACASLRDKAFFA